MKAAEAEDAPPPPPPVRRCVRTARQHGRDRVSAGDRGGGLESGSHQNPEEQTAALLSEQEEVQRGRLPGGGGGRSPESRRLLPLRGG